MTFEEINKIHNTEFTNKLLAHKHIFYEIYEACANSFEEGCGSYLFDGQLYSYCDLMYEKQELLYKSVKDVKKVLEIGVYMGHSLFIMLLSNPELKITCIDINDRYALPAITILNKYFNNAITFIHSDSLDALKNMKETFDFFHVDGKHENKYITEEFYSLLSLNEGNSLKIIFDDQQCLPELQSLIHKQFKVLKKVLAYCHWNNVYFEIKLANNQTPSPLQLTH